MIARAPRGRRPRGAHATSSRCCSQARDEDGEPLTDQRAARRAAHARARRPRDDGQLARLDVRAPRAHPGRLRPPARGRALRTTRTATAVVEATIHEAMRLPPGDPDHRPPRDRAVAARRVRACRPTRRCSMSILLLHHREDVYPDPFAFRPERFLGRKPGHLHVDPVRRRHPALPRRDARDGRAARRAASAIARRTDLDAPRPGARAARCTAT